MAVTDKQPYTFEVREYEDGTRWIVAQPREEKLEILGSGFLGLHLPKGTAPERAEEIAEYLRRHIIQLSFTAFGPEDEAS